MEISNYLLSRDESAGSLYRRRFEFRVKSLDNLENRSSLTKLPVETAYPLPSLKLRSITTYETSPFSKHFQNQFRTLRTTKNSNWLGHVPRRCVIPEETEEALETQLNLFSENQIINSHHDINEIYKYYYNFIF